MGTLRGIVALLWIIADTLVGCVPLYLLGLLRLISPPAWRPPLVRGMHAIVQTWAAGNRLIFRVLGIIQVRPQWPAGELSEDQWYLVVSNHQSWADILILQNTFQGRIPILKFFTKRQLQWVPLIGAAMWFLGFPYVRRLSRERIAANPELAELDRAATLDACRGFRDHPTSVLAFLEGTRFTAAKHASQDEARFDNLLNPKLGGVSYVVTALGDRLDAVIDVTLVYDGGPPTFWQLLQGRCPRVDMLVERRELPAAARNADDPDAAREALRPWLDAIWREKDERLSGLRARN
jgi:1-acyl-sn-glycerol-3-phosphate acyltransferase